MRNQRWDALNWWRMCQIMNMGMVGQRTGTGALAKSCNKWDCNRPGAVASNWLPRIKDGKPAKPGTITANLR